MSRLFVITKQDSLLSIMSNHTQLPTSIDDTIEPAHRLAHQDAANIDSIDHHPGTLARAERAAKRAQLKGLDAEQAQAASGTVNLLHRYGGKGKDNVVLAPAPTADPQGNLLASMNNRTRAGADRKLTP